MSILILKRRHAMAAAAILLVCAAIMLSAFAGRAAQASAKPSTRELPIYSVATQEKKIAISFDAAWGADKTSQIMDVLEEYQVDATFFLVGFWVEKYPDKVAEIARRGFEIGNHSTTHPQLSTLTPEQILLEADSCSRQIEEITGVRPTLLRPPFGDYNDTVVATLRSGGYEVIQWSVDSLDWKSQGIDAMVKRVTKNVQPGSIVLFHNNSDDILEALPIILEYFVKNDYEVVCVGDLLLPGPTFIDNAGTQHAKQE